VAAFFAERLPCLQTEVRVGLTIKTSGDAMFEPFADRFAVDLVSQQPRSPWSVPALTEVTGYRELMDRFAGCTFERGLYRLHDARSGPRAARWIAEAFPEFAARALPFGFDWSGGQFAIDLARREGGEPQVLLLEPGTGEALKVAATFATFHDEELPQHTDAALGDDFFARWASTHAADLPLRHHRCVGYKVPLFLGGVDDVENLELVDLEVYWSLVGQLRLGAKDIPMKTTIGEVSIE
jgi:Domain of unknown function (DUF1851)/SMI1 / KNR4 family (SUKH-1)